MAASRKPSKGPSRQHQPFSPNRCSAQEEGLSHHTPSGPLCGRVLGTPERPPCPMAREAPHHPPPLPFKALMEDLVGR